ncbi:YhgE/Pip domain-containing protein [Paenibacillus sp. TAF58]
MAFFKQKTVWIGLIAVFVVLTIFGVAMMGSVLGSKPKNLPVALVVEDGPATLQNGSKLNVGEIVKEKLLANKTLPIEWHVVATEAAAYEGLDQQDYYGAFVLPANLSAGVASLAGPEPQPATVRIIGNDGMNMQASTTVKQILGQVSRSISAEMSQQVLGMISQQTSVIPVGTAKALLTPFDVQEQTVHLIGANNASGNAPGMLTQIMWIGSLVVSILLFLSSKKVSAGESRRIVVVTSQAITGIVFVTLASGFLVWMATAWYGMPLVDSGGTWMVLMLAGVAFYLLQSAVFNWIGLLTIPIMILLMFFSMPVVNMAPEFLPQATQDWLYAWTPLKFAASALRNSLYFADVSVTSPNLTVLWSVSGAGLSLLLASAWKMVKAPNEAPASVPAK